MSKKIKVLFYYAFQPRTDTNRFFLGTSAVVLKTYIDVTHPDLAENIEWIQQQFYVSDNELVKLCNDNDIDVLCTSHYVWNHSGLLIPQLEKIKSQISAIVVSGGPSITVHTDKDFFTKHPYIDYAVYGPGERAVASILDSIVNNKKLLLVNCSNLAFYDKDQNITKLAKYEYVPILKFSPYVYNKDMFEQTVKDAQSRGYDISIPYDSARGCPYSCTFCDWNSGLSNKVSKRKGTYKEEIELFIELGIRYLYLSDANVGQYDEDIDMIEYMAQRNLETGHGFQLDGNLSKLKKDNNLKIIFAMARGKLINEMGVILAIQDINKTVLENAERPDVSWEVHKSMIHQLYDAYPQYIPKIQLILGLPGQTLETWRDTLRQVMAERIVPMIFFNELLPTSPAVLNPEYQQKFKYVYSTSERIDVATRGMFYRSTFPKSCISFTQRDFVKMAVLTDLYVAISIMKRITNTYNDFDCEPVIDYLLQQPEVQNFENNLYNNWTVHDKFYYTKNLSGLSDLIRPDGLFDVVSFLKAKVFQRAMLFGTKNNTIRKRFVEFFKGDYKEFEKFTLDYY